MIYQPKRRKSRATLSKLPRRRPAAARPQAAKSSRRFAGTLLASADVAKGEAAHKACLACHDFSKGGPNKTGPNLWDVVDRPIAAHEGFAYSDAMKAHSADKWTYENLITFLNNPKGRMPGTKMVFGGMKKDQPSAPTFWPICARCRTAPKPFPAP